MHMSTDTFTQTPSEGYKEAINRGGETFNF